MSSVQLVSVFLVLLALLLDSGMSLVLPMDCSDIYNHSSSRPSGVYTIYPIGSTSAVQVFQRRMDSSVNFYRLWDHYKTGFGNAVGEYWLGLETLSHLSLRKNYELLVDMEDFAAAKFSLGAGDSLSNNNNGQKFTTLDKDQDTHEYNCARSHLGGFWYSNCHHTNPNGVYRWGADDTIFAIGVSWFHWKGHNYSLKSISMKVRPVQ
ncbi:Microfibril-associated glycoprotein 4 [Dissostichus eleginoides]|uniref:Microfibril-associated glycoprotein 4 n=1 Tax=Dissostichus eleginoides TaxID=100907 RepID=A0AAD9B8S8_DISEL|nr:Microfibril-associated glycoprotein 4 [Dissostichus eleginoides]